MYRFCKYTFFIFVFLLQSSVALQAKIVPIQYGLYFTIDKAEVNKLATHSLDSTLRVHPMLSAKPVVMAVEHERPSNDRTPDFYVLLFLCFILGIIRSSDHKYFINLFKAFWNPTLSNRQLKDQLQSAALPGLLMNFFFTISTGIYMYYVVRNFIPQRPGSVPPSLLMIMLIMGTMLIYLSKYAVVRFSGWAFRVEGITEHYLFNVFLINKIIAICLLPFIVLLAFAGPVWAEPVTLVSLLLTGLLLLSRYTRSWQVFGSFFQYSKFHFFMYLCASEILPLAVLMKLLVRGLMYY